MLCAYPFVEQAELGKGDGFFGEDGAYLLLKVGCVRDGLEGLEGDLGLFAPASALAECYVETVEGGAAHEADDGAGWFLGDVVEVGYLGGHFLFLELTQKFGQK